MKRIILISSILLCILTSQSCDCNRLQGQTTTTSSSMNDGLSNCSSSSGNADRQSILQELANNMTYVQGGTFTMGATGEQEAEAEENEKPAHSVTLKNFYICKYEVTQELWQAVMGNNPSEFKGNRKPVECVSWDDCQTFISKLDSLTGKKYRLPSEAEWEFAARGGIKSKGYKYSGSNTLAEVAWYDGNSGETTHDVGTKQSNELGLYDMSGNVWEWCNDRYGNYNKSAGRSSQILRVYRGGSWYDIAKFGRLSYRSSFGSVNRYCNIGLRLCLSE